MDAPSHSQSGSYLNGITTKQSPTKRSLTNGSRQMAHDEWLGLGLEVGLSFGLVVELGLRLGLGVSEPFVVNHIS